ncbi:MAG: peroxidase family protein [Planctomycetota bacterium]
MSPERRSSLFQRGYFTRIVPAMPEGLPDGPGTDDPATFPDDIRTINGRFNNLTRPWWGSAGIPFTRMAAPAYGDASGRIPARIDGPSPRAVSQAVLDLGDELIPSRFGDSNMFWLWGQFLDHDMDETPIAMPMEPFDIGVPVGDPWFDPGSSGTRQISLDRSGYQLVDGRREQVNRITAFIDASLIYGSDPARAAALRASDGTGELATSDGDLMPYNVDGFPNANDADDPTLFLAGDVRSNESVTLIAIHTLFVREHNHWAREIRAANPDFTGDEVYEHARAIMSGIMQAITYNEFLPLLLGPDAIPEYTGYDATVDPGISNVFATASFRLGHSMLPPFLERLDSNGLEASEGHLSLRQAFFTPEEIGDHGIDSALRGACLTVAENLDHLMIDDVRNFLFGMPGMGGFDLASLNIQRGRDHGLPDYNTVRQAFGLAAVDDFDDISPDPAVQAKLASVYATCDDVDPWVGMLAEPAVDGGMVGETLQATLVDQFVRVRDGDRFWYEAYLPADMIDLVNAQTLSTIIRRNTSIGDEIGDNAFIAPERCAADLDGDTELTIFDFLAFQTLFDAGDLRADFDGDGALTVFDFLEFQNAFDAGCD